MWKPLSEEQRQSAHEHAIDQCLHIDDNVKRKTAIAREAVNTGASAALDMASQWLAAQSPVLHEKFLQEFGQGAGVETTGNVSGLTAAEERDQLAAAIRDAAVRVGICRADACLTGPHLLMLCNDLVDTIEHQAAGESAAKKALRALVESLAELRSGDYVVGRDSIPLQNAKALLDGAAKPAGEPIAYNRQLIVEMLNRYCECVDARTHESGKVIEQMELLGSAIAPPALEPRYAAIGASIGGMSAQVPEGFTLVKTDRILKLLEFSDADYVPNVLFDQFRALVTPAQQQEGS